MIRRTHTDIENHRFGPLALTGLLSLAALMWAGLGCPSTFAEVRTAKVAGQFYPEGRTELIRMVHELLERQPEPVLAKKPRILIVPHAGYPFSGPVAASGFRHLAGHTYDGVVLVAFTHRFQFDGSSVDQVEAYETPIGLLPVDREAAAVLAAYPGVTHLEAAHETNEHSLEVELPFLQLTLARPRIVPVLMGGASLEDASRLARALAALLRLGDYLFVFSTDLSHYHPYHEAETLDEATVRAILFETPQAVERLFGRGKVEACGLGPILTSLSLAKQLGYLEPRLLSHANSGDTAGHRERVVGYAAIAMYDRPPRPTQRLSAEAGAALVHAARQMLERTLAEGGIGSAGRPDQDIFTDLERYPELSRAHGIFVTLRRHGALRGCIGRIHTDEALRDSVGAVAVDAALHDPRFPPVNAEELHDLHIEVSVLTAPERLSGLQDLVAGRDGVILQSQGHSGVFLPQVWEETGWTREEFLRELASQKAGLPPDAWQHAALYTFQDQIFEEPLPSSAAIP